MVAGLAANLQPLAELRLAGERLYRQDYHGAGAVAERLLSATSEDPTGLLIMANVVRLEIYDSGNLNLVDSFYRLSSRLENVCRVRLEARPDDAWACFCHGVGLLNQAEMLGWQQQYLRAIVRIAPVTGLLNRALAAEPDMVDCWLGIGLVEFFKAQSRRYTLGLPLFGSVRQAREQVERTAAGNGALADAARFALAFMAKQDGRPREAIRRCEVLLLRYPGNRAALRLLRDALLEGGDYRRALEVAGEIEQSIRTSYPGNLYGLSENWLVCGKAYLGLGMKRAAAASFRRIIALAPRQSEVPWLRNYIAEARALLRRTD